MGHSYPPLMTEIKKVLEDFERAYFAYNHKSIIHYETYAPVSMDIRDANNIPNALFRKKCVDDIATVMLSEEKYKIQNMAIEHLLAFSIQLKIMINSL